MFRLTTFGESHGVGLGGVVGQGLLQISLVLFIVFFLYRDGARIEAQLETGAARLGGELGSTLLWIGHAAGIKGLLSAEENLAWLCALHRPASREAIWQALAAVGLRGFEDVPCHTLSAGQQRRVALARLYLDAPPLWILDEPFTALDKQGVAQLEAHLAQHCERGGLVVLTTHHTLQQVPSGYRVLDLGQRRA